MAQQNSTVHRDSSLFDRKLFAHSSARLRKAAQRSPAQKFGREKQERAQLQPSELLGSVFDEKQS